MSGDDATSGDGWILRYDGYDPRSERLREVLCALGNGRFATRAAAPEAVAGERHYPGTYAAGVFNRLSVELSGRRVENESMVNLPDWQSLTLRVGAGPWLDLDVAAARPEGAPGSLRDYRLELDLRRGVLTRTFTLVLGTGSLSVVQRRVVSMADPYIAGLGTTLRADGWSGPVTVRSGLDARVGNTGVARYAGLGDDHLLRHCAEGYAPGALAVDVETNQSRVRVGLAARHQVLHDGIPYEPVARLFTEGTGYVAHDLVLDLHDGAEQTVEKVVALYTEHDRAITEPGEAARNKVLCAPHLGPLIARHALTWGHLWENFDIELEVAGGTAGAPGGEPLAPRVAADAQTVLRLHVFHLLQTVSHHSADLDVGIPARGLHGEAYRGHIFWDEMFVFPFLTVRAPEIARSLLRYRWRRLPAARKAAHDAGFSGAMFPWQSGSDGREETQVVHLNPRSGRWLDDHSHRQRHIGVSVAYNAWQYYEASGDLDFLAHYGAELLLEVGRYFASAVTYDESDDRFDLRGVMGPDEYHDAYPWRDEPGLDNNAYTNVMVVWVLQRSLRCLEVVPQARRRELLETLGISENEVARWDHVSRRMRLAWHEEEPGQAILSQFEGYERLAELDWEDYYIRYGDIGRLDRILEAEGDSCNRYRLSKQADVLMLFYLLSVEEITSILDRLGYRPDPRWVERTIAFYLTRTAHGSTLSKLVHAWVLARTDRTAAWNLFRQALASDVADVQGGTTEEGIHLGAMAGTVDLLQRGFTGLELRWGSMRLSPQLPREVRRLRYRMRYRDHSALELSVETTRLVLSGREVGESVLPVTVSDRVYTVGPGGPLAVPLT